MLVAPETLSSENKKLVGSSMVFEEESVEAVRQRIEGDVYWTTNVVRGTLVYSRRSDERLILGRQWDKEKLVILPYLAAIPLP